VREVTGKPILFVGSGEKSMRWNCSTRAHCLPILGMETFCPWWNRFRSKSTKKRPKKLAKKISKGQVLRPSDLRDQLTQLQNMGGMAALMDKLPAHLQANAQAAAGRSTPKISGARWGSSIP